MTKGFAYTAADGKLTFHDTGRTTLVVPDSIPVIMLPTVQTVTDYDAVFPDASKGRMFTHLWRYVRPPASFSGSETGRCFITAHPQEWSQTATLMAAPTGCDIFIGQIRVTRTAAPSHTWLGSAINKMVPENVWMPVAGGMSMLLEAHFGFARAMSIFISGGNLVLHQQQSIGAAPGGYGGFGTGYSAFSNPGNFDTGAQSGETTHNGTPGWPIYYPGDTGAPHYKSRAVDISEADPFSAALWVPPTSYRQSGSSPPSLSDPTNYSSTWQFDLRGRFGRRS